MDIIKFQILEENITKITFYLTNQEIETGFTWREIGVIVEDPISKEEILYCYGNAGENAEYISSVNEQDIIEKYVSINLVISNVQNITAVINQSLVFALEQDLIKVQENLEVAKNIDIGTVTIAANTTITNGYEVTLPIQYQVGNNSLELRLDSEVLKLATDTEDGHYKEIGTAGAKSNIIQFYRTTADGNWTLDEDATLTAIVRRSRARK